MNSKKLAASFGSGCVGIKMENISEDIVDVSDSNGDESSEEDWEKVENVLDNENSNSFLDLTKYEDSDNDIDSTNEDTKQSVEQDIKKIEKVSISGDEQQAIDEQNSGHISFTYAPIPPAYPREKIIVVTNLAPKTNRHDLIAAFSKYGTITHIQKMSAFALIAFSTKDEAQNATLANNLLQICGRTVGARVRDFQKRFRDYPSDQVAFIFDLMPNIPDKIIREHFVSCGNIIAMPYYRCRNGISRVLIFEQPGSIDIALRLDGSNIGTSKIRVKPRGPRAENYYEGRTVVMLNVNEFDELAKSVVIDLFSKCGKITECDMLCNIKKLAIITFKNQVGVENAMKLSGTTVGKIKILLDQYTAAKYKHTKIIAYNLAPGITKSKIGDAFKEIALIDKVHFVKNRPFALIEFATTDDYCNAFRLDGEDLCGQELVLKPFPDRDESLEHILYGSDDWIAIWGDRPRGFRGRKRRLKK